MVPKQPLCFLWSCSSCRRLLRRKGCPSPFPKESRGAHNGAAPISACNFAGGEPRVGFTSLTQRVRDATVSTAACPTPPPRTTPSSCPSSPTCSRDHSSLLPTQSNLGLPTLPPQKKKYIAPLGCSNTAVPQCDISNMTLRLSTTAAGSGAAHSTHRVLWLCGTFTTPGAVSRLILPATEASRSGSQSLMPCRSSISSQDLGKPGGGSMDLPGGKRATAWSWLPGRSCLACLPIQLQRTACGACSLIQKI